MERGVLKINNRYLKSIKRVGAIKKRFKLTLPSRFKTTNKKWTRWPYLIRKLRNRRYRPFNPRTRKYKLQQRLNHGRRMFLRHERRSQAFGSKYRIRKLIKIDEISLVKRSDFLRQSFTQSLPTKQLQQKLGLLP